MPDGLEIGADAARIARLPGGGVASAEGGGRGVEGGKPNDPVAFHAAARYPTGDFGEYWKKKDDPDRVRAWGWILMIIGVGGIIQTLWRVMRALSGT